MQMGIDLAREPDRTVCVPIFNGGAVLYYLHRCVGCVWRGRGGDDCDDPSGGVDCKLFTPNVDTLEQARILTGKLQMAYLLHLINRQGRRLHWLEQAMDQLRQVTENRRQ